MSRIIAQGKRPCETSLCITNTSLCPIPRIIQLARFDCVLSQQGKLVALVGDGVSDAPAFTDADVASGGGTDAAIESAGLILVNTNPLDVLKIFKLTEY